MKNKFNRTLIVLLTALTIFSKSSLFFNTFDGYDYGVSTCGIEDEEEPFDEDDRPNKS